VSLNVRRSENLTSAPSATTRRRASGFDLGAGSALLTALRAILNGSGET
jgi:hypothetical protein